MKHMIFAAALLVCSAAHADEASKRAKIGKLVAAHGLVPAFQQQLDGLTERMSRLGDEIESSLPRTAVEDPVVEKRREAIQKQYMRDVDNMFSVDEMIGIWAAEYSKHVTEAELDQILAYYASEAGKKDGKAAKAAMTTFIKVLGPQSEQRSAALVEKLMNDLKAAGKKKRAGD